MPTPEQLRTLHTQIAPAAVASEKLTALPAEVTAGQCILESGWLAAMPPGSKNCFSIKATKLVPGRVLARTHEWFTDAQCMAFRARGEGRTAELVLDAHVLAGRRLYKVQDYFAAFPSLADCFAFHGRMMLTGAPYREAARQYLRDKSVVGFIAAIAPHYSTATDYAERLGEIALSADVCEAVDAMREAVVGYGK